MRKPFRHLHTWGVKLGSRLTWGVKLGSRLTWGVKVGSRLTWGVKLGSRLGICWHARAKIAGCRMLSVACAHSRLAHSCAFCTRTRPSSSATPKASNMRDTATRAEREDVWGETGGWEVEGADGGGGDVEEEKGASSELGSDPGCILWLPPLVAAASAWAPCPPSAFAPSSSLLLLPSPVGR